jgi:exosortase A
MTAILPIVKAGPANSAHRGWLMHLAGLAMVAATILLLFRHDAADMVTIWLDSSTFNHCALILPIIGWLVWQRLPQLRQLEPATWAPGLLLVAAGAFGWLLGDAGSVALARHVGLVMMLQGAVVAFLGRAVAQGLAFPLFYAFFLVPAGEEIVPLMQTATARMCMALLGLVGVPAHIEGVFISIPNGYFEVAEACSGVKFLIAMIAYGALVANVCFRSWPRRLLFMAVAIAIPVLANGVRAWATIYIAHLTSADFAAGIDHVVYGWIFFAIVIALIMAAGWRFFDRGVDDPWFDPKSLQPVAPYAPARQLVRIAAAAAAIATLPLVWSAAMASTGSHAVGQVVLPQVSGWTQVPQASGRPWQPHFAGADTLGFGHYQNARGQQVDLAIALYARQREGREIVGYGEGAVGPNSHWAWTATGAAPPSGRLDRITSFGTIREVATFYRVGAILTGNPYDVKLQTVKARLLGGDQRAVAVLVSAQAPGDGLSPRPAIDAFLAALGPVDRLADAAGRR